MPHVRISPYPQHGSVWRGVKTEVNGIELPDVRDITLRFPLDAIATLDVEMLISKPFTWEGDAMVNFHIVVPEGFVLVEEIDPTTGYKKYLTVHQDDLKD